MGRSVVDVNELKDGNHKKIEGRHLELGDSSHILSLVRLTMRGIFFCLFLGLISPELARCYVLRPPVQVYGGFEPCASFASSRASCSALTSSTRLRYKSGGENVGKEYQKFSGDEVIPEDQVRGILYVERLTRTTKN